MKTRLLIAILIGLVPTSYASTKPKYGPQESPRATALVFSTDYFRSPTHTAPDFWALIGYYTPQFNPYACSAASLAMTINAAKAVLPKKADDAVISQKMLIESISTEQWKQRLSKGGVNGINGVTLDQLKKITEATFKKHGFPNVRVDKTIIKDITPETKKKLIEQLQENEKSANDFIIVNFNQQVFTDDADAGHIAPIAAFDADNERVLILDPDREYYEPYWVSVDTLIAGMNTKDPVSGQNRGYIYLGFASSTGNK
jgi:hypothetical protein